MADNFREEDVDSLQTSFGNLIRSLRDMPLRAWLALVLGLGGLVAQSYYTPVETKPVPVQANPQLNGNPSAPQSNQNLPEQSRSKPGIWLSSPAKELIQEICIALIVAFCLAFFLDEPLRKRTITNLGRDIAPFWIAALTVPEMRHKMRQICESKVIRKDSVMQLQIEEVGADKYRLHVQMRSKFCNISNTRQKITARVAVDQESNGEIVSLRLRPVNLGDLPEKHWTNTTQSQPLFANGRRIVLLQTEFPRSEDWEKSYIEVTGQYEEDVYFIGTTGKTLFESLWPLMGVEIECISRPDDVELNVSIPFTNEMKRIEDSDRWISPIAILPGERVDIVLTKKDKSTSASTPARKSAPALPKAASPSTPAAKSTPTATVLAAAPSQPTASASVVPASVIQGSVVAGSVPLEPAASKPAIVEPQPQEVKKPDSANQKA